MATGAAKYIATGRSYASMTSSFVDLYQRYAMGRVSHLAPRTRSPTLLTSPAPPLYSYMTKYDCSSADVNPIGGVSKVDLKQFLRYAAAEWGYPSLRNVVEAPPTAELRPLSGGEVEQTDEDDMGMTYAELSEFGKLRKMHRCGPVSMYQRLLPRWLGSHSAVAIADKVKHFFKRYGQHRHKLTTLTPAYHAESYSPDDNRFDLRPFLQNVMFDAQFAAIDRAVAAAAQNGGVAEAAKPTKKQRKA